jgi:hypothetical protein
MPSGYLAIAAQEDSQPWAAAIQTAVAVLTGAAILGGAYRATKALLTRTVLSRRHLLRRLEREYTAQ